ncbi:MAG: hypothetical protein IJ104_05120, partial [Methanobrevibacter sp.]|nr:hypothetical protein [Methanobrevibacter sp.]
RSIKQYDGYLTLTNSIILDGLGAVNIKDPANATLINNWWGQNDTTKDLTPKELNLANAEVTSYLYLNLTIYSKGIDVGDAAIVNINLVSSDDGDYNIVNLPVTITAVNGTVTPSSITLINGKDGEVQYVITEVGDNTVTVDILGVKEVISLTSDNVISTEVVYVDYNNGLNSNSGVSKDAPVRTIEKAMKLVENNGIIYVANGVTYLDDSTPATGISINKNVLIIGESLNAVISGNDAKRIFNVANGFTLTITNLTLTNGYSTAQGGAIFINTGGKINISNSVISNSHANSAGGAIGATQGYIDNINNVTFINNYAGNMGGAVGISSGSKTNSAITIGDNCKFINNTASHYGSAVGANNPYVTIGKNNLFEGNKGIGGNGKGAVASNQITLGTGNVFINNHATQGGALFAALNSGSASGSYCFFINNTDNNGYTLGHYSSSANNKFTLNDCYWGSNTPDFNAIFNKQFAHNTYLIFDVSVDKEIVDYGDSAVITITLVKNSGEIDVDSLPDIPLEVSVINGTITPENVKFEDGSASVTYTPQGSGEGSVIVTMYTISETLRFATESETSIEITSIQGNGTILGILKDKFGLGVAGQTINLTVDGASFASTVTNNAGEFTIIGKNGVNNLIFEGNTILSGSHKSITLTDIASNEETNKTISDLEKQLEEAQANATALADELAEAKANLTAADEEIAGLESDLTKANEKVANLTSQLENITAQLANKTSEVANLTDQLAEAQANATALADELAEAKANLTAAEAKVADLTNQLDNANSNITNLTEKLANTTAQLEEAQKQIQNMSSELIPTVITVNALNIKALNSGNFQVTLKDNKGNALANKTVSIIINGVTKQVTTDSAGIAKLSVKYSTAGTYNAVVTFLG